MGSEDYHKCSQAILQVTTLGLKLDHVFCQRNIELMPSKSERRVIMLELQNMKASFGFIHSLHPCQDPMEFFSIEPCHKDEKRHVFVQDGKKYV